MRVDSLSITIVILFIDISIVQQSPSPAIAFLGKYLRFLIFHGYEYMYVRNWYARELFVHDGIGTGLHEIVVNPFVSFGFAGSLKVNDTKSSMVFGYAIYGSSQTKMMAKHAGLQTMYVVYGFQQRFEGVE
jgi:hypothetical protein